MEQFRQICLLLLTPECYDEFFVKFNFLDGMLIYF